MMKMMISHFPIFQAIFPMNPSTIRIIAITMKMIPRVRIQLAMVAGYSPGRYKDMERIALRRRSARILCRTGPGFPVQTMPARPPPVPEYRGNDFKKDANPVFHPGTIPVLYKLRQRSSIYSFFELFE